MKDCNRKLPNPALQAPRDAGFQELEHASFVPPCTKPADPAQPRRHTRLCPLYLQCVSRSVPFGGCFVSVCHAEKVGTDPGRAQTACFVLSFPPALSFLPRPVQGLFFGCVTAARLSSLGPAPRLQSPGSLPRFPPHSLRPACPHARAAWFSLRRLGSCEEAPGGGDHVAGSAAACGPGPLLAAPPPTPMEAHLLCLAACANVGQGDRLTLILSLAELGSGFLEFSTRGPFLGFICSVSCLPVRHLDCFLFCFSVPFPLVVYFL